MVIYKSSQSEACHVTDGVIHFWEEDDIALVVKPIYLIRVQNGFVLAVDIGSEN